MDETGRKNEVFDLFVIGGGVNGCGIARDAAGRGWSVALAETGDLAQATSSASTKLFHGGLRYLEFLEFSLVRKALVEREVLLANMPHIARPMRFVLPLAPDMEFDAATPVSRLLGVIMPWARRQRPVWVIRLGLFLYDHLGGRKILPATRVLDLRADPAGDPLRDEFGKAFEYSDCWVDDARLVMLNARDAGDRGARIMTRTRVVRARRERDVWRIETEGADGSETHWARALVNAGGPWVAEVADQVLGEQPPAPIRLVRGSHIIVPRLFDHDRAYFLQGPDGRIVFAIPYQTDFTLIGTTEEKQGSPDDPARISAGEDAYLRRFAGRYFRQNIAAEDVVWTYSGVRPLIDVGSATATSASRDYHLVMESGGAPVLHVYGGKITTYRVLAEDVLARLETVLTPTGGPWTEAAPLPGGDFPVNGVDTLIRDLQAAHPFLDPRWADRLVRAYGTEAVAVLGGAQSVAELGRCFGDTLYECEVRWMIDKELARTSEDVLWRRSKLGLRLSDEEAQTLAAWMEERV